MVQMKVGYYLCWNRLPYQRYLQGSRLTYEVGTDRWSRNVSKYQPTLRNMQEERRSHLHRGGNQNSLNDLLFEILRRRTDRQRDRPSICIIFTVSVPLHSEDVQAHCRPYYEYIGRVLYKECSNFFSYGAHCVRSPMRYVSNHWFLLLHIAQFHATQSGIGFRNMGWGGAREGRGG
jgi:hypothetical protein